MHLSEIGETSEPFEDGVQIKIINNIHRFFQNQKNAPNGAKNICIINIKHQTSKVELGVKTHRWSIDKITSQNINFTIQVLVSRGDYALFYLLGEGNLTSAPFSLFLDSTKDMGVMSRKQ